MNNRQLEKRAKRGNVKKGKRGKGEKFFLFRKLKRVFNPTKTVQNKNANFFPFPHFSFFPFKG